MASFHQDNISNIQRFLNAVTEAIDSVEFAPDSTTPVIVFAYTMLISGFLKFRQRSYSEALDEFNAAQVLHESMMQSKVSVVSLFEISILFMSGSCHAMLKRYDNTSTEIAMRKARHYIGNGDYMRILYHTYILLVKGVDDNEETIEQFEKILELFKRFRCPQGQEIWASILAQGIILAALFLGLLYRKIGRVDDALRIFRMASSQLITKACELCDDKYHVGKMKAEKARKFVDAFAAVFKFSEAECFHIKNCKDEMWECIADALDKLSNCRGQFERIEQKDVFAKAVLLERFNLRRGGSFPIFRANESRQHAAPRFLDTLSMAPLLESWCDALTRELQYILYTTERDITQQILQQGARVVSAIRPDLFSQFQVNPCKVLRNCNWIPDIHLVADAMTSEIFSGVNSQRAAAFELIKQNVRELQQYAVEFIDYWKESFFLLLRLSLCNDLLNSFGFLKE